MAYEEISLPPMIRMEEVEEAETERSQRIGFGSYRESVRDGAATARSPIVDELTARMLEKLVAERQQILADEKLNAREKERLLETNRKTIVIARGGSVRNTENVMYSILVFGGVLIIALSLLTVYKDLPKEIVLAFVGTVLGGTIATMTQKLGKV